MLIENIPVFYPQLMRALPNWVLWKKDKVPYSALYDGRASVSNPSTWATFDTAFSKFKSDDTFSGLGFVFTPDTHLIFVDIDHCVDENGMLNQTAQDIVKTIGNTYIELSQSGTGLHIFALGEIPKPFKHNGVEMYFTARYVAMTGKAIKRCEPSDKHDELMKVYQKYKTPEPIPRMRITAGDSLNLSDDEIIRRASESRNGELFRKLMSGDISDFESHSNADFKLCKILAFWSDRDGETIERIFTSSGLCRDKWTKRPKYREQTINRACESVEESISEYLTRIKPAGGN